MLLTVLLLLFLATVFLFISMTTSMTMGIATSIAIAARISVTIVDRASQARDKASQVSRPRHRTRSTQVTTQWHCGFGDSGFTMWNSDLR